MEDMGAGELVIHSVDRDGTMTGYDFEVLEKITEKVTIPVIALGGAGNLNHLEEIVSKTHVSATAAGSMFVFNGPYKAVLINYPKRQELENLFINKF